MSAYPAIRSMLDAIPSVSSLVGTRIYPIQLPTGTARPAITMQRISGTRNDVTEGSGGLMTTRFQLNIAADTVLVADIIANDIATRLQGWFGFAGTLYVQSCVIDNQADVPDIDAGADDQTDFVVRLDITLVHGEPQLTQAITQYEQE